MMFETAILACLATLGVVLLCCCVAGIRLLPVCADGFCVIFVKDVRRSYRQFRAVRFLVHTGFLRIPVLAVDCTDDGALLSLRGEDPLVMLMSYPQWEEYLDTERKKRANGK